MYKRIRKGQTIVEVMVAMTVLILALSSTFILIINVVNLVIVAQNRTEAVAISQKGLAEGKLALRTNCTIDPNKVRGLYTSITDKDLKVTVEPVTENDIPAASKLFSQPPFFGNFNKLTSTVTWIDKGGVAQEVVTSQIVRGDGE